LTCSNSILLRDHVRVLAFFDLGSLIVPAWVTSGQMLVVQMWLDTKTDLVLA